MSKSTQAIEIAPNSKVSIVSQSQATANEPEGDNSVSSVSRNESQTIRTGPTSATRSYMYLDSASASLLYEKDGDWVLEKLPSEKPKDSNESEYMDEYEDYITAEPAIVAIDAWTSHETVPCNLCDKEKRPKDQGNDVAPVWTWMYNTVSQLIGSVNDYKRSMLLNDISCGEARDPEGPSVDNNLVSTKGTQMNP